MDSNDAKARKAPQPERTLTDESLKGERTKTDDELARRAATFEENADAVVADARVRADSVLSRARAAADDKFHRDGGSTEARSAIDVERRVEDASLGEERQIADAQLEDERIDRRRALSALLELERKQTDVHLHDERLRADRSIESRDDFLAVVSHDLRNMLGGIVMSSNELLEVEVPEGARPKIDKEAERIQRFTARMSRLLGDLLDVVSIEAGRLAVAPRRHDAVELLRETQDVFQSLAMAKGISIRTEVRAHSLLARYDHERVLQVLANLVGNALKFTPRDGRVDLLVERIGDDIRFCVADTGRGVSKEQVHAIFDKFWQRRAATNGFGLGLYISKCIVEAHGGKIWAESTPGAGSTFYFTLPAAASTGSMPESGP